MEAPNALFVASTGQYVGKTTTCLGLFRGLQRRFSPVGFMKPVEQQDVEAPTGMRVDKDVLLFHEHFHLQAPFEMMSPVLIPQGFTRDFLDGKISEIGLKQHIQASFHNITSTSTRS